MVYSGRPSKSCLHCRHRRIKVPNAATLPLSFTSLFLLSSFLFLTKSSVTYLDPRVVNASGLAAYVLATEMKFS